MDVGGEESGGEWRVWWRITVVEDEISVLEEVEEEKKSGERKRRWRRVDSVVESNCTRWSKKKEIKYWKKVEGRRGE